MKTWIALSVTLDDAYSLEKELYDKLRSLVSELALSGSPMTFKTGDDDGQS